MPRAQWKSAEDRLCRFFNTTRRPLSGGNDKRGRDDSLHDRLFLESKYGKCVPLFRLYREARDRASAEKRGRTPVIGLQEKFKPGILLVIHSDDFEQVVRTWVEDNQLVLVKRPPKPKYLPSPKSK